MRSRLLTILIVVAVLAVAGVGALYAAGNGPVDPPSPPESTSSFTLNDIWSRLNAGTAGTPSTFSEPASGPTAGTMRTLDEIMLEAPAVDATHGATAATVASGKTFWGLTSGQWGLQTGTANLGPYNAGVPKTWQTTSYAAGDDGDLEKGVAWPNPRFTDNGNGTVTDNLTGLIWLKNANCASAQRNWATALTDVASLNSAGAMSSINCSDTSNGGAHQTDWRLPNVREMQSLIDFARSGPAVPSGHPFNGLQSNYYWTSTSVAFDSSHAWLVGLHLGFVGYDDKTGTYYVWPVRGGQ